MWVPYYAGKLHLGSNQGFVAQFLGLLWALVDVSLEESSGVVSFPCHLVYVMVPVKLVVDGDPEVLCRFYYLQDVSMDGIWMIYKLSLVAYLENLAFLGVEFHEPVLFPLLEGLQVFLEKDCILRRFDTSIKDAIVSEESH